MRLRRRELFGLAASVVVLSACGSGTSAAPGATADDDPVFGPLGSTVDTDATIVAVPSTAAESTSSSASPPTAAPAITDPPTTAVPETAPPTTLPPTTVPPSLPTGAQTVPAEGEEVYAQLGSIRIPAIGVDAALGEGVTLTNLNHGPGHWPGTALPGELGNVVVGGHRVSHTHPFLDLDKLVAGDTVTMSVAAGEFTYTVTSTEVVLPTEVRVLDQTEAYTATLFACTPKHKTSHRIIVHLEQAAI